MRVRTSERSITAPDIDTVADQERRIQCLLQSGAIELHDLEGDREASFFQQHSIEKSLFEAGQYEAAARTTYSESQRIRQ